MFGALRARRPGQAEIRFRVQKAASLLGCLAFYQERTHPREVLIEMLWPEAETATGRHRLRMALSFLRRQLETPDLPAAPLFLADRQGIQLNPECVTTDIMDFMAALERAEGSTNAEKRKHLTTAVELYRGPLLPGCYEAWIVPQQLRLEDEYVQAVLGLLELLRQEEDLPHALSLARLAVSLHPLREELHLALMRLLAATDQPAAVLRQYNRLTRLLRQEFHADPSATTQAFANQTRYREKRRSLSTFRPSSPELAVSLSPPLPPSPTVSPKHLASLPWPSGTFVGREAEHARILERLNPQPAESTTPSAPVRLLTLTGMAGSGKTRLALEAAHRLCAPYQNAVWYVTLADTGDPRQMFARLHEALGLAHLRTVNIPEQIVDALSHHPCLLVLDNLEHLLPAAATDIHWLLQRTESLRCLVTSQQTLNLSQEQELPVTPLPLPNPTDFLTQLLDCASVQLFMARAQQAHPGFQLTAGNARAVAELCMRLEGLPLALELAAAQVALLSPAQILGRLVQRFDLLVSRKHDVVARHRTLRAAIDWSYHLLPPELQRLFARLAVFHGGWRWEDAQAICDEAAALEPLAALRERSLIIPDNSETERRFRMLESLRDYALERLPETERALFTARHARYYGTLVEQAAASWWGPEEERWMERLAQEVNNVRAALRWLQENAPEEALSLCAALTRFWYVHCDFEEGRQWMEASLARMEGVVSSAYAATLSGIGLLAREQGDYRAAVRWYEASLTMAQTLGDRHLQALSTQRLAFVEGDLEHYDRAFVYFEEALTLHRDGQNRAGVAMALLGLAWTTLRYGDVARTVALCREMLAEFRELGNRWGVTNSLFISGEAERQAGNPVTAIVILEECLHHQRVLGSRRGIALTLLALAAARRQLASSSAIPALLAEALDSFRAVGDKWGVASTLEALAILAQTESRFAHAARLLGAAFTLRETIGAGRTLSERREYEQCFDALKSHLGLPDFEREFAVGRTLLWTQVVTEALTSSLL